VPSLPLAQVSIVLFLSTQTTYQSLKPHYQHTLEGYTLRMKYVKYHEKQVSSLGSHALNTCVKMEGYAKMALGFNTQF